MLDSTLNPEFTREDFILRDYLAADRTILANERTFLAYVRTAFTAFILGASFIKFFPESFFISYLGWIAIMVGFVIIAFGTIRYKQIKRLILDAEKKKKIMHETDKKSVAETLSAPLLSRTPAEVSVSG